MRTAYLFAAFAIFAVVAYELFANQQDVLADCAGNYVCPCTGEVIAVENDVVAETNPCTNGPCAGMTSGITNDPSTWPTGDRIWDICRAVAMAEGANISGSAPDRANNPGDISDGYITYGGFFASGSNITQFPDKQTGWQWLYNKWSNIINGGSAVYKVTFTWSEIAIIYAGNSSAWLNNVTSALGVSPDTTPKGYVNG